MPSDAAAALVFSLVVLADPAQPARARADRSPLPPLGPGVGEVVADGTGGDAGWVDAEIIPLEPTLNSLDAPTATARVALGAAGLALRVDGLAPDQTARWTVDPDGLAQRWFEVGLSAPGAVSVDACTLAGIAPEPRWLIPEAAAPCAPVGGLGGVTGGRGEVGEVVVPWSLLDRASTRLRLVVVVSGLRGPVATSAAGGQANGLPGTGRTLRLPALGASWTVTPDVDAGVWRGALEVARSGATAARGGWTWTRWNQGRVLDQGAFEVTGAGRFEVEMPDVTWLGSVVEARGPGAALTLSGVTVPLARAASVIVWRRRAAVALGAPVVDEAVPMRWEVPDDVAVRVQIGACEAEATLPEGQGELRATGLAACGGEGPLPVRVWAGERLWLDEVVVRVPAGGAAR